MSDKSKPVDTPRQEWRTPVLMVLGDTTTLTAAQALAVNDGGGGSS
jgi:hypothetical protein